MKQKIKIGDIVEGTHGKMKRVEDFLPPPEELLFKYSKKRVSLDVDTSVYNFFKNKARKLHTSYKRIMLNLLNDHAQRTKTGKEKLSTHSSVSR